MLGQDFPSLRRHIAPGIVVTMLAATWPGSVDALDNEAAHVEAIQQAVTEFRRAFDAEDFETVIDASVTPRAFAHIVQQTDLTEEALRAQIVGVLASTMAAVTFESYTMDTSAVEVNELENGTLYAFIPTEMVMENDGSRIRVATGTMALLEDGKWYLVRIDPAQISSLKQVYPEFSDIDFPEGKREVLGQ